MTKQDFAELYKIADRLPDVDRLGVFSPIKDGERKLFPKATWLPRRKWDLNRPSKKRFDVLIASNVFMYSPDPARWFRNVMASCKYLLILDPIRRKRTAESELGSDGDQVRFSVGDEQPRIDHIFDLQALGDRLLAYKTFYGGSSPNDEDPMHVVALIKGDLADPLVRIDDYPSGVRPILPDLAPLHKILGKFESAALPYHLGIVPALLTEEMWQFLERLEYLVPVMHGYDHAYPKYSAILQEKNDIYNQSTLGVFNEFSGQSYDEILQKLEEGRGAMQSRLNDDVTTYIPPCNIGDRKTGRALEAVGFSRYLSKKRIPGCRLPWIKSDFDGRSPDYDFSNTPDVVNLHVTWEWDVEREGDSLSLDRLIEHLQERLSRAHQFSNTMISVLDGPS